MISATPSVRGEGSLPWIPGEYEALYEQPEFAINLRESPRWLADGTAVGIVGFPHDQQGSVVDLIEALVRFDGGTEYQTLVQAGEVVPASIPITPIPGDDWVFGGVLDNTGGDQYPRMFRGVGANGVFVTFFAGLARQSFYENDPVNTTAEAIGIFRLDLSTTPPTLSALAIGGELVSGFLASTPPFLAGAHWEIPLYAGSGDPIASLNVPPRYEPRLGNSGSVALNRDGLAAFRTAVRLADQTEHGALFAEISYGSLRFVAVEERSDQQINTGFQEVGSVIPTVLGLPVIDDGGDIAFYSETKRGQLLTPGSGAFFWEASTQTITTIAHSGQTTNLPLGLEDDVSDPEDFPAPIDEVEWAPVSLAPLSVGQEIAFSGGFVDLPAMNCRGDVAFRLAYYSERLPGPNGRHAVARWTRNEGGTPATEVLFAEGMQRWVENPADPMGPKILEPYFFFANHHFSPTDAKPLGNVFNRPAINAFGEVACVARVSSGPIPGPQALFLHRRGGEKVVAALTGADESTFRDPEFEIIDERRYIADIINLGPFGAGWYRDVSLNDRGQISISAGYSDESAPAQASGRALLIYNGFGDELFCAANTGTVVVPQPDFGAIVSGAGSLGEGDAVLTDDGRLLWAHTDPTPDTEDIPADKLWKVALTDFPPPLPCRADINDDNSVNTADLGLLLGQFGTTCPCSADLNGDNAVDAADLGLMLGVYAQPCQAGCDTGGQQMAMAQSEGAEGELLDALNALGWESVEEFVDWSKEADPEKVIEAAQAIIDTLDGK